MHQVMGNCRVKEIENPKIENECQSVSATKYNVLALIEVFCFFLWCNLDPVIQLVRMKFFKDMISSRISYIRDKALKLVLKPLLTFHGG